MSNYMKSWKTVDLATKNKRGMNGGGIGYSANSKWYNDLMVTSVGRQSTLDRYEQMDATVDISRALDIMSEDVSSDDYDQTRPINFTFPDDDMKASQLNTLDKTLDKWMDATEFDYKFFDTVRELLKFGLVIFKQGKDGTLIKLVPQRIIGYILDSKDRNKVDKYLYDNSKEFKDKHGDIKRKENDDIDELSVKDLIVLKLGDTPMGEAVLARVYRIWRQLNLLEDAVVIYRIVRAPERRVFYIDTGNISGTKAEAYLTRMKNSLRQKQLIKDNSNLETQYNPASTQEDYFIAQNGDGRGSRVETLAGGDNLGRIEDLQYFNKKMSLGLRIPPSYLDSFGENGNEQQNNDGRVGTAYISEMRYASFIKRLQKGISKPLFKHFEMYAEKEGIKLPERIKFEIAPPQNFALYKENELASAQLNVFSSADSIEGLSKVENMKKFLGMDANDIEENTVAKLLEMGIEAKLQKKIPEWVRTNLVYGDGESGRNFLEQLFADVAAAEGLEVQNNDGTPAIPPEEEAESAPV